MVCLNIFEKQFKKKIPLTVVRPGTQKRDFTHIDDIINGCYLAFRKGRQNEYMLGTNKKYSILQIAKMFKRKIKFLLKEKAIDLAPICPIIMLSTIWVIKLKLI